MEKRKRYFYWLMFVLNCLAVIALGTAMATQFWVESKPQRVVAEETKLLAEEVSNVGSKFKGYIHFGLFHGYKELDHGLGPRQEKIQINCDTSTKLCQWMIHQSNVVFGISENDNSSFTQPVTEDAEDHGEMDFALWVAVVCFLALSIVFGLVSMSFSVVNAMTRPIETLTGPLGLYLWNGIAAFFSLVTFILYLVLFMSDLSKNVLSKADLAKNWTSDGLSMLGYSFYLVVVATGLFAANIAIVLLSGVSCKPVRYGANVTEKPMDGVMMY